MVVSAALNHGSNRNQLRESSVALASDEALEKGPCQWQGLAAKALEEHGANA